MIGFDTKTEIERENGRREEGKNMGKGLVRVRRRA